MELTSELFSSVFFLLVSKLIPNLASTSPGYNRHVAIICENNRLLWNGQVHVGHINDSTHFFLKNFPRLPQTQTCHFQSEPTDF